MTPAEHVYSVLIVSAAEKINNALLQELSGGRFDPVIIVDSIAKAQRKMVDEDFDLVFINAPLPDDFGRKFAIDVCTDSERVAIIMVRSDMFDEISSSLTPKGVMVIKKPLEVNRLDEMIAVMCSVRERLRRIKKKTVSLEEKMEEIRLVNRAKWALIKSCHMTEENAHRYIQKQAMDLCLSKKETAENILKTYG
jgi:response regulator NasT